MSVIPLSANNPRQAIHTHASVHQAVEIDTLAAMLWSWQGNQPRASQKVMSAYCWVYDWRHLHAV